jgi:histidine triad (HIT) family protein
MVEPADCIFCKIVAGDIPCIKIVEDEATLAFMDINPANPGHALAIIKEHWENIFEIPGAALASVIQTAQRVALAINSSIAPGGINLIQANGPAALNSVPHLHFHILPRTEGDDLKLNWGHQPGDVDAIQDVANKIRAAMS